MDTSLNELHRQLAALVNNHVHFDLRNMPEVERLVAIEDILEQIESSLMLEKVYGDVFAWKINLI